MRKNRCALAVAVSGMMMLAGVPVVRGQNVLIESFENTNDGWLVLQSGFQDGGFSTTTGVTNGSYSWVIAPSATPAGPNYGPLLASANTSATGSMSLTALLGGQASSPYPGQPAQSLSIDVTTAGGTFGYMQWDLVIDNQDTGYTSVDGYSYSQSPNIGNTSRLTFTLPTSLTSALATSTNPTRIVYQVGGSGSGNIYVDNVMAAVSPPIVLGAENSHWIHNGNGTWETGANWNSSPDAGSIPGAPGTQVTFDDNGGSVTANPVITLSSAVTATLMTFGGGGTLVNYTINNGSNGSIASTAEIDAFSGSHTINVRVSTSSGNYYFDVSAGASLKIPNFSDNSYGSITKLDGGTVTLGTSLHLSITVDGTMTFLDNLSGGFLFGINANSGSTVNMGKNRWDSNSIAGDAGGGGVINIPIGGTLYTAEYLGAAANTDFYSGTFSGGGSLVVGEGQTSTDSSQIIYGNTLALFGNNSGFSGTMTAGSSFPTGGPNTAPAVFTLQVGAANNLGDGSATNKVILDGGVLQATGSFAGTQGVVVNAVGGTVDTNSNNVGLGNVTSTGALSKVGGGVFTAKSIRGGSLTVSAGSVEVAPSAVAAGVCQLVSLSLASDGGSGFTTKLDIHNNALILTGMSYADVLHMVKTGLARYGGNGMGIASTEVDAMPNGAVTLAVVDDAAAGGAITSVHGYSGFPTTGVIVSYALLGDANLDGAVNGADLALIQSGGTSWYHGDFSQDGKVSADDYGLLNLGLAAYNAGVRAVPEPGTAMALGLLAMGAMRRRRV